MSEIIVFGDGGHAKVVIDCIEQEGKYKIRAIVSDNAKPDSKFLGYDLIDFDGLRLLDINEGIIAIGDNYSRYEIKKWFLEFSKSFKFISTIHPKATISKSATIGSGTVIFAGAVVNPYCKILDHCILNTGSTIDHDSTMNNYSSLAPGVHTGGNVEIGKYSVISIGASIIHGIKIGNNAMIGANSAVIQDIEDNSVVFGSPAKFIRERKLGEKYL